MVSMAQSAAQLMLLEKAVDAAPASVGEGFSVRVSHRLDEVETVWRALTAGAIESPGQDFGFTRLWVEAFGVREADQFYITAYEDEAPVALIALQRRWDKGLRVLSWFPGSHVGCDAPIIDATRVAAMAPARRRRLWLEMLRGVEGADVVYLKSVLQLVVDGVELFAELGQSIDADTLYRASFASFEEADKTQRNKSRRKHDRQQGEKLEAIGEMTFEELGNGETAVAALDTMFRQRAARFREMGVFDPFAAPAVRKFYDDSVREGSGVSVKLHLLRLNGEIVAMRYNIAHGDRLFCLISSMSEDPALRPGSPGKQCLLRVMQTMFGEGFTTFDMGEGLTDEKRHWCNVQIPVRHHYVPITRRGAIGASLHRGMHVTKARIKSDPRLLRAAKQARGVLLKLTGKGAPAAQPQDAD
jgi:CelD/BcsL family acetyltransferase involved in cellulose biosynthesis